MMAELLINSSFDDFLLSGFKLSTMIDFEIEGKYNKEWGEYEEEYILWKDIKPTVYGLIKGNKTPLKLKAVMVATDKILAKNEELINIKGEDKYVINIKYEKDELSVTSAISMASFSLDNQKSKLWDGLVERILDNSGIEFEEI